MSEKDEFQSILEKAKETVSEKRMASMFASLSSRIEELIEATYWEFDARRKGYGDWKGRPQSERDAFKWSVRKLLSKFWGIPHD